MTKRAIRIEGDVAYVSLTKGYEAVIDASDVPLVEGCNWFALVTPRAVYAMRADCSGPKQRAVMLHRVLMGTPEGLYVDHIDGDGLHNRRSNLREATKQQNNHNARTRSDNSSGYKGVSLDSGRWRARIMLDKKSRLLGYFGCPTAAHFAYIKASRHLHGEFGRVS